MACGFREVLPLLPIQRPFFGISEPCSYMRESLLGVREKSSFVGNSFFLYDEAVFLHVFET